MPIDQRPSMHYRSVSDGGTPDGTQSTAALALMAALNVHVRLTLEETNNMWQGQLLHIHTARAAREAMQSHLSATLMPGVGIAGDRYATALGTYSALPDIREVTLIEDETLIALQGWRSDTFRVIQAAGGGLPNRAAAYPSPQGKRGKNAPRV